MLADGLDGGEDGLDDVFGVCGCNDCLDVGLENCLFEPYLQ